MKQVFLHIFFYYSVAHMISWIKDSWGTKIFKYTRVADVVLPSHVSGHELKVLGLGVRASVPTCG